MKEDDDIVERIMNILDTPNTQPREDNRVFIPLKAEMVAMIDMVYRASHNCRYEAFVNMDSVDVDNLATMKRTCKEFLSLPLIQGINDDE